MDKEEELDKIVGLMDDLYDPGNLAGWEGVQEESTVGMCSGRSHSEETGGVEDIRTFDGLAWVWELLSGPIVEHNVGAQS